MRRSRSSAAKGVRLYDAEGREYIDLLSGIGVSSLGHAHPRLSRAVADQARRCSTPRTFSITRCRVSWPSGWRICPGLSRAFFCNSGTEAVEACLKFARRYWYTRGEPRTEIIALEESFHGRTFGSLSVTVRRALPRAIRTAPARCTLRAGQRPGGADRRGVESKTAAIIAEPVQGEGGIRPLTPAFARAITEACSRTGALLIADEVQSGLGRTGYPFYFAALGLKPHLVSIGKALGGGVPVGAALVSQQVADAIHFGDHGSTYGGNLLACRAALMLPGRTGRGRAARAGRPGGRHFERRLRAVAARHPVVKDVRGKGLMWGLELSRDAAPVVPAALERGLIVNRTAETVVRLLPPLIITEPEIDEALDRLDAALGAVGAAA